MDQTADRAVSTAERVHAPGMGRSRGSGPQMVITTFPPLWPVADAWFFHREGATSACCCHDRDPRGLGRGPLGEQSPMLAPSTISGRRHHTRVDASGQRARAMCT